MPVAGADDRVPGELVRAGRNADHTALAGGHVAPVDRGLDHVNAGKQLDRRTAGWEDIAGDFALDGYRSATDVVGPDSLLKVREYKKAAKLTAKSQRVEFSPMGEPKNALSQRSKQRPGAPSGAILNPRSLLTAPLRLGFAGTQIALGTIESAVNVARLATSSVEHEIGQALDEPLDSGIGDITGMRAPLTIIAQVADLLTPDRPFGRLLAVGGPLDRLIAPGGVIDRLTAPGGLLEKLTAPGGLLDLLTDQDGALMRIAAENGPLDRLTRPGGVVDQITENEGVLERLTAAGGIVDRLTAPDGVLTKLAQPGGVLDRAASDDGLLDQLLGEDGALEQMIAAGGPLDKFAELSDTLAALPPNLTELQATVDHLNEVVELLNSSVAPLGGLAERLPKRLTRGTPRSIDSVGYDPE